MQLNELIDIIEISLPKATAMEGDRIGLQIQSERNTAEKVLITLEMTDEVVAEAVTNACDCVVSFHPLIYKPLAQISNSDRVGRICSKLIKNDISLIVVHTNFDAHSEGTSKIIADKLNLKIIDFLLPDPNLKGYGMGIIAEPKVKTTDIRLIKDIAEMCMSPLKYCKGKSEIISKIAIVGGSGTSFMQNAIDAGVDALITADVTYHTFHAAEGNLMLIDPGHYEMEQFVSVGLAKIIIENTANSKCDILLSKVRTNPVGYYPDNENYIDLQKRYLDNI